jgi:hypothetical protein
MSKLTNSLLVLGLAFVPLFFASPAQAETIQFTYYWTSRELTFTDQTVNVVVTNDITNKIGGNGEVIDTYRITLTDNVIEKTEKHGPLTYSFTIVGTQTLKLEGIDNGYWSGFYGPIMTVTSEPLLPAVEPVTESPTVSATVSESVSVSPILWDYSVDEGGVLTAEAPSGQVFSGVVARYVAHEMDCGLDVSDVVGAALIGSSSGTIPATNESFGDPCPGWYKKLVVSVQYSPAILIPITESPTLSITVSPEPTPIPQPTPEPAPSPEPVQPQPSPEPAPSPEPTASSPTQSPEPEPTESPTIVDESPTQSTQPEVPPVLPTTSPEALPLPTIFPSPAQSIEETYEEPATASTEAPEVTEETQSESVSATIQAAVSEAIGAAVEAVGELVEAFQTAGLDMTPEQREEAQDVVISTIIVSQVASTASAAAVSARKIK